MLQCNQLSASGTYRESSCGLEISRKDGFEVIDILPKLIGQARCALGLEANSNSIKATREGDVIGL